MTIELKYGRFHAHRDRRQAYAPTPPAALESVSDYTIKPKKKALLIGVQYSNMGDNALQGPHRDVTAMRQLLIEKYEYRPKDIVTLVDTKDSKQKQPTHDNMIEEMQNLVKGATAGDRFFFHYSGHATQVHNKEEDGMDECNGLSVIFYALTGSDTGIVPSDCNGSPEDPKLIKDDVLKKILVDSLPTGSHLVAIFDSCHSASLLDLKHFRCNRVYAPWMSKGRRRSNSMWYANVRKNAAWVNTRTIHQTTRMSNNIVKTRRTSLDHLSTQPQSLPPTPASHFIEFTEEPSSSGSAPSHPQPPVITPRPVSLDRPQIQRTRAKTRHRRRQFTSTIKSKFTPWLQDRSGQEDLMCESPTEEYCTGRSRPMPSRMGRKSTFGSGKSPTSVRRPVDSFADVISLGSNKDDQTAREDLNGMSMTRSLVEILSSDPHPTFKDFMTQLSYTLHDKLLRMSNFQDPQTSSHKR
ncbi:hypothetical protein L218DRAFT_1071422 [Marasmius fiardii PR-910]|nr:hypothetical protein L218DRAFT_1071422 [Marasmius fiardii PR-910]